MAGYYPRRFLAYLHLDAKEIIILTDEEIDTDPRPEHIVVISESVANNDEEIDDFVDSVEPYFLKYENWPEDKPWEVE